MKESNVTAAKGESTLVRERAGDTRSEEESREGAVLLACVWAGS